MKSAKIAAKRYIERGWAPIPIPYRAKKPIIKKWQTLRLTLADLCDEKYFNGHRQNIGNVLGEASNGLTDVDQDCPEAIALAGHFLPPTKCIFGRASAPHSHWLYIVNPPMKSRQFGETKDQTTKSRDLMLVEIRSTNHQTVFPPSVHECGEPIEFNEDGEPAVVDAHTLERAVSRLAAACLLVRYWPDGARQDATMALVGALLRCGWDEEEVTHFLTAVVTVAKDEELKQRLSVIPGTVSKLARNEPVWGWPKLGEFVSERVMQSVRDWCGNKSDAELVGGADDVVRELNSKHAVVMIGGRCAVLTEIEDARRNHKMITLSRQNDFTLFYKNRYVRAGQ